MFSSGKPGRSAAESLRQFVQVAMTQRNELVLPLHGGPPIAAAKTRALQTQVNRAIEAIIARGQLDGTVTALVTAGEIVTFGAMLDSPTRRTRARFAAHDDGN